MIARSALLALAFLACVSCRGQATSQTGAREPAGRSEMGVSSEGSLGGNSMEAEYPLDLSTCAERARLAFLALAIATTGEERRATWARLDGLTRESVPVRISMERGSLKHTRVVFGAGNEKSEENQAFVQRMKEAFERAIPPTRSAEPGPR